MNSVKYLICSLMLIVGLSISAGTASAAISGIDDEPASALVVYYNTVGSDFSLQITNTNVTTAVSLHVQTIETQGEGCAEILDFPDSLTAADTKVYSSSALGINNDSEGFVVVYSVDDDNTFLPIDFPHLIGHAVIASNEGNDGMASLYNASGRLLEGGVYELIQPTDIMAPYQGLLEHVNIASVAWTDNYTVNGSYDAEGGTASATGNDDIPVGVLNWDDNEDFVSCGDAALVCAGCTGIVDDQDSEEGYTCTHSEHSLCSSGHSAEGFVSYLGVASTDNLIALVGEEEAGDFAGLDYVAQLDPTGGAEPPVDCSENPCDLAPDCVAECIAESCQSIDDCSDPICNGVTIGGAVCNEDGTASETDCADETDNDGDGDSDCADDDCSDAAACEVTSGGGGGGGGCSVATAATGLGSMANALVLIIPAFGIGARRIRQRLNK